MKRIFICLAGLILTMASCTTDKLSEGYIGPSDIVIPDGVMTPETLLALGRISDPQLSPDGSTILYSVSYTSIAENRSCANLFVCNTDGSNRRQLTSFGKSVSNARWSADGSKIYFIYDGQLREAPYSDGELGRMKTLSDVPSGISGFAVSPDETRVIYISSIKNTSLETPSDSDPALDKAQAYATEELMYRHWDHWRTEVPRSYVAPFGGARITPDNSVDILGSGNLYELPLEPYGGIEQLSWAPDSRHLAYSCKKLSGIEYAFSTNSCIYVYDCESGATTAVTTSGGYDTDPVWSEDGKHLAWISMERDGYEADRQRLMLCETSLDGGFSAGEPYELNPGFDNDIAGIVWHGDEIFFSSLVSEAVQAIFCADLGGQMLRVTSPDWHFDFDSPFAVLASGDEVRLLTSYQSLHFPTELVAVDVRGTGTSYSQITSENAHILDQLADVSEESVLVETVDHKQMQCWILYPPQFDSTKVYPAVEIVLGGPQGTNSQAWSYRWCYRLMAQQGYVVIMPNRRGTTAFGQEWKEQISGDYSGLNMQDYLSAGKYLKSKPYIGKLACVGASYGGYSAYMLEGMDGGLFDCFIAHAGIFDEKQLWFTTEEMWFANWDNGGLTEYAYAPGQTGPAGDGVTFGGMQQAGAPYAATAKARKHYANSPSSMVTKWDTPILCIHGMMDFRIPYEQGMAAFNAAQMMGVPSKLVIFPEENHWILQPQNSIYWHRVVYDWLDRWLKD